MLGVATVLAVRRRIMMRDALAEVAPELRSPILPFVPATDAARKLPMARLNSRLSTFSGPDVSVTKHRLRGDPPVRVRVTAPTAVSARARPAVLWIHGGGYVVGSPQLESVGIGRLARTVGAVVVAPEYRLAPQHPFPAALDDCMATLRWMQSSASDLGIDPQRIAVIGGSAGGGLAASVAQRSHDEGIVLRAQVLMYPMIDDRTTLSSDHEGRGRFVWTASSNRFGWTSYLGRPPRASDAPEYAAPSRRADLTGLPPAWIGVGELDLFYDEDIAYAERLRACGVSCELVTVPGMYHGADGLTPKAPSVLAFHRSALNHLVAHL